MRYLCLATLFFSLVSGVPTHPSGPTATNVYGKGVTYYGLYANEVEAFIGIRYGHDTSGKNRFRPPRPYLPQAGSSLRVHTPGPSCPQRVDHRAPSVWNTYDYVHHICESVSRSLPCLNAWQHSPSHPALLC